MAFPITGINFPPKTMSSFHILMVTSAAITITALYFYQKKKKDVIPSNWKKIGTVSKLNLYPLKSGRRNELVEAECTNVGLKEVDKKNKKLQLRDRFLIVFTEKDHEFRTARNIPKLMTISVSAHDENHLKLDAPSMNTLLLKIPDISSKLQEKIGVKFHDGEIVYTVDCGNEVAKWLSKYLLDKETGLRLGYNDGSFRRDITRVHKELINYSKKLSNSSTGLYSDLASLLLVNQSSVNDLNTRLENPNVTTNNFRPNIVVDGPGLKPYAEDDWDWIKIGDVVFRNVVECTRCMMTTLDPETGIRAPNGQPLKTLKTYRFSKRPEKEPIMGINLEVKKAGIISVGDNVLISL